MIRCFYHKAETVIIILNANQASVLPPFMGLMRYEGNIHYAGRSFPSRLLYQYVVA
jgi:hypothetical protein